MPFYAILRSIPNKLLGVVAMFGSLLILLILPLTDVSRIRGSQFRPLMKLCHWFFIVNFLILLWIGACHPESPYLEIGQGRLLRSQSASNPGQPSRRALPQ